VSALPCLALALPFYAYSINLSTLPVYLPLSFGLVLSCLVLSCLVLSSLVLSCLVLSCLVLSCLALSCLALTIAGPR
jgi:hypothetical protein